MIATALTLAAAASGALAIAADWEERRHRTFFVLKPLTTLLILGVAATAPLGNDYTRWVLAALALSLCGDVFLMFDARYRVGDGARASDRAFLAGLGSFLLAHVAFVCAFVQGLGAPELPGWLAAVVFYAGALLFVVLP
ncbi:MAG: lysoplasmalogenase family protein, partial [Burkholderiales bacterium]